MGCASSKAEGTINKDVKNPVATFTTSMGAFKVELYLDRVPITVSNIVDLAQSGYYNGLHFHRVIPGAPPRPRHHATVARVDHPSIL